MLKRSALILSSIVLGALAAIVPSTAQAAISPVYNQPGDHYVNGRWWKTSCAMYSSNVVRCTTQIWGSKVVVVNGAYTTQNGWVFNNLTYLPQLRSTWGQNKLANTTAWTDTDGSKWKTECDTAATGANVCRSYTYRTRIIRSGDNYVSASDWIFNNQVLFTTSADAVVSTIPAAAPAISGVPQEATTLTSTATSITTLRAKAAAIAKSKVGSSYRYGASGPSSFDCSGLTSYAYRQVGITLPRSARTQFASAGTKIAKSQLQVGDLVFYYSPVSHAAIYIGNGQIVDAANTRTGVRIASLNSMPYAGAVRVG